MTLAPGSVTSRHFQLPNLKVHALVAGNPRDPVVVLLHGFPELAESWRDVLPRIAEVGFYAVAPDLRGYGGSEIPEHGYDVDTLARDVTQLFDALGVTRAHLVGHDWGGAISYHVAQEHPERVKTLSVVNCPPPELLKRQLANPRQLKRFWYILAMQLPWLPERALMKNGASLVARILKSQAKDRTNFTDARLRPYLQNFQRPEAARASLEYYREATRRALDPRNVLKRSSPNKIRAPFRLIWGEREVAFERNLSEPQTLAPFFEHHPDVVYLPEVSHFGPIEKPDAVAKLLIEHLKAPSPRS